MAGRETDKSYATEQRLSALINRMGILTDTQQFTVTQVAANPLCNTYTIPAGGGKVGAIYRGRLGGTGQQAAGASVQLTLQQFLAGANVNQVNLAAAAFAAATPFDWDMWFEYMITQTGVSGLCRARLVLAASVNNAAANTGNGVIAVRRTVSISINTTIANTIQVQALWGSNTGSPTITADGVSYERIGP